MIFLLVVWCYTWMVSHDKSCCNQYRYAARHHDSTSLSVHDWFQQSWVVLPCLASSVFVFSSAELIFIFAKFKIAASAASVKHLKVLDHCYDPLTVSHNASSKRNETCVGLDDKNIPSVQKWHGVCDKCKHMRTYMPTHVHTYIWIKHSQHMIYMTGSLCNGTVCFVSSAWTFFVNTIM